VALIGESGHERDRGERFSLQQQPARVRQPHGIQIDMRRHAEILLECAAEINARDTGLLCQLVDRNIPVRVGVQIVAHPVQARLPGVASRLRLGCRLSMSDKKREQGVEQQGFRAQLFLFLHGGAHGLMKQGGHGRRVDHRLPKVAGTAAAGDAIAQRRQQRGIDVQHAVAVSAVLPWQAIVRLVGVQQDHVARTAGLRRAAAMEGLHTAVRQADAVFGMAVPFKRMMREMCLHQRYRRQWGRAILHPVRRRRLFICLHRLLLLIVMCRAAFAPGMSLR